MSTFTLAISCLTTYNLPWFMDLTFQVNIALYSIEPCFYHQSYPQLGVVFALAPSLHSFWSFFLCSSPVAYWTLLTWGAHLLVSYLFTFSYCSWGSQGKNTEAVCHSLLQWTTFCQLHILHQIKWIPRLCTCPRLSCLWFWSLLPSCLTCQSLSLYTQFCYISVVTYCGISLKIWV